MTGHVPPTLTDGRVVLRPWRPDDADTVFEACQDPLIARFVPIPQPYTREDAEAFVTSGWRMGGGDEVDAFAIDDAVTGRLLGSIARSMPAPHRAVFGYWLAPAARGRGIATAALRLLVDRSLATPEIVRLELFTDVDNAASGRVAERAGFQREGVRRAWTIGRDGRPMDALCHVRLRPGIGDDG
jgi:RimJ/RimL family protein N-acetyltransferase